MSNSSKSEQKKIVLVEVTEDKTNQSPTIFPKDYDFRTINSLVALQFISNDHKAYQNLICLRSVAEIVQFTQQQLKNALPRKIYLRSVRSLHFSREQTLKTQASLEKLKKAPVEYDTLFFQINNYSP